MKIPKRFKIFAETIEVVEESGQLANRHTSGTAHFVEGKISLVPIQDAYPATTVKHEQDFCHELVHHIGEAIGLELSEKDTDLFGRALHQALTTMEYEG